MVGFVVTDAEIENPQFGRGLVERDFSVHPLGWCEAVRGFDIPLIPRDEMMARWDMQKKQRGCNRDLMRAKNIQPLNQDRTKYCWAYSSTFATMMAVARSGRRCEPLSGTSIACKIKNFRNQGGWCTKSMEYITEHGVCRIADWPQGMAGLRRDIDTPGVWKRAKRFRVTEWMDLEPGNIDQLITCLLLGLPVATDYNWWGHSVCTADIADLQIRGGKITTFDSECVNSWGSGWGDNGRGVLRGRKTLFNSAVVPMVVVG